MASLSAVPGWLPNWRDDAAYRLGELDRPGFAWEWLRRDFAYRAAAAEGEGRGAPPPMAGPARWGLVAFVPPERTVPWARPIWSATTDRSVLLADATPCHAGDADGFSLERHASLATRIVGDGIEHLLLSDGWRHIRLDIVSGTLGAGTVLLSWRLSGIATARSQTLALRRFLSAVSAGRFPRALWPTDVRTSRWALALRVHDALAAGASQRDIAVLLAAGGVSRPRWRAEDPSLRLRAQRIVALARSLQGRGFADRFLS